MGRLQKGVNDLESWCLNNGEFGEQLKSEWTGECEDGKHYEIDGVSRGSHKKFKWKCSKGHKWFSAIRTRTTYKTGCPYCFNENRGSILAKARLSEKNSLKTWCSNNGSFGKQLMTEWTGDCEDENHYNIDQTSFSNGKKFKWVCSKGHEWFADVVNRTTNKTCCPYCYRENQSEINTKAKLSEKNSLKTWCLNNGSWGKQLLDEWTGECEDNKHYELYEVARASKKKFKWRCSDDHEWYANVVNRTAQKQGCPYCSNTNRSERVSKARLSNENSLKTWCLSNASFGQQLISEWTGECEDGKHYKIDEVSFGSKKKLKWKCSKGHNWSTTVVGRTSRKTGCPYCNNQGTSYPEQFIYHSLKQIYPSAENRCKVLKSPRNPQGIEFDVGVPEIPLCIEYSPTYWHEGREERDQYKKPLCKSKCKTHSNSRGQL